MRGLSQRRTKTEVATGCNRGPCPSSAALPATRSGHTGNADIRRRFAPVPTPMYRGAQDPGTRAVVQKLTGGMLSRAHGVARRSRVEGKAPPVNPIAGVRHRRRRNSDDAAEHGSGNASTAADGVRVWARQAAGTRRPKNSCPKEETENEPGNHWKCQNPGRPHRRAA